MEDMDAFERQLATVMQQGGRASLPVDATAIVHSAVTSNTTGRWTVITRRLRGHSTSASTAGGFSVFSAVRFAAAAVIVALFGGFLLAGVLTTPEGDEVLPAAVTESPSPMTTEELLSGMVTEEVELGVFKVVHDGVRGHSYPLGGWGYTGFWVDVTPGGSVWLSVRGGAGANASVRTTMPMSRRRISDTPRADVPFIRAWARESKTPMT